MAWFLVLYGPTHQTNQSSRFLLAPTSDPAQVSQQLDDAQPGQFVIVPVVFEDEVETVQLRVQPHLYGAWVVQEVEPGSLAPQRAARARQPDWREVAQQFGQLGEAIRAAQQEKPPDQ